LGHRGIGGAKIKPFLGEVDRKESLLHNGGGSNGEVSYPSNLSKVDISTDARAIAINGREHSHVIRRSEAGATTLSASLVRMARV
jgi:hypothetical protein